MKCSCEAWVKNIEKLDGAIVVAALHGVHYTADFFRFCPWCSSELEEDEVLPVLPGEMRATLDRKHFGVMIDTNTPPGGGIHYFPNKLGEECPHGTPLRYALHCKDCMAEEEG